MPATYKEIKEKPHMWVITSPKSQQRLDNGIFNSFYEMKSVVKVDTQEIRIVKIYRKAELSPELLFMVKEEIMFFRTFDHPNIAKC